MRYSDGAKSKQAALTLNGVRCHAKSVYSETLDRHGLQCPDKSVESNLCWIHWHALSIREVEFIDQRESQTVIKTRSARLPLLRTGRALKH